MMPDFNKIFYSFSNHFTTMSMNILENDQNAYMKFGSNQVTNGLAIVSTRQMDIHWQCPNNIWILLLIHVICFIGKYHLLQNKEIF